MSNTVTSEKVAIFFFFFDPFTIGHNDIVERALRLFDKVIIAIGVNGKKKPMFSAQVRHRQIGDYYKDNQRIEVITFSGLTADLVAQYKASALVRGIRSGVDYEYERTLADINHQLSGVDTVLLFTQQNLSHISSGSVRELISYGYDVSGMLPPGFEL